MRSLYKICLLALYLFIVPACNKATSFQEDPLCEACIERACETQDPTFEPYVTGLDDETRAQMIAMMEAHKGCFTTNPWAVALADEAYKSYGQAFFAPEQPFSEIRTHRALEALRHYDETRPSALAYLRHHADAWKDTPWGKAETEALSEIAEDDDIFSLLVLCADSEMLEKLAQMPATPARNNALLYRWKDLGEESQKLALSAWIGASWHMQQSGSAQLPQYLSLDWKRRPFPEGVPNFVATLKVDSIKIGGNEAKRGDTYARDAFNWPPISDANAYHGRVDLSPWLSTIDTYPIAARATIKIWPERANLACLDGDEACTDDPIMAIPVVLERSYRVFGGLETGAPGRNKNDADNKKTANSLKFTLCSRGQCMPLWDGAIVKERPETLQVMQGEDFYLLAEGRPDQPIAMRLMARTGGQKPWNEIGVFYGNAPTVYAVPMRADLALGDLCANIGQCNLELELRPSLRMARRDPRISRYFGGTIALGQVKLDILNRTPYSEI